MLVGVDMMCFEWLFKKGNVIMAWFEWLFETLYWWKMWMISCVNVEQFIVECHCIVNVEKDCGLFDCVVVIYTMWQVSFLSSVLSVMKCTMAWFTY